MNLSIAKKMYLLAVPTLVMGVAVGVLAWNSLRQGTGELKKANELAQKATLSRLYVAEMSDGLKGYLLNPSNKAEADKKMKADENNGAVIESMKSLTSDPQFLSQISELGNFDESKLNPAENKILELVNGGKYDEARQVFVTDYSPLRVQYNKYSEALAERANKLSAEKVAEVEAELKQALHVIFLSLGCGILLILSSITMLARQISMKLRRAAGALSESGSEFQRSSQALAQAGQAASAGTTQAAASLEETVASVEELSSMVTVNAESARKAAELSQHSASVALNGQNDLRALGESMAEISGSAKKIADITNVIDDIAFQTNLLALNAAVEAARAGEQGRGFAVVAEAVRNLAQRSAVAAKDISALILDSSAKTERGVQTAAKSGTVLDDIVVSIKKVADLNSEISTASSEQAHGISQISKAMQELDRATQTNAASADQVATEADEISSQANSLRDLVVDLRSFVNGTADEEPVRAEQTVNNVTPFKNTSKKAS